MDILPEEKSSRLLDIYSRLVNGEIVDRTGLAQEYNVSIRSIQRDIDTLRCFLAERQLPQEIVYSKHNGGYRMVSSESSSLTNDEILAVCKILLESRSMRKDEMLPILDKLIACAVPNESKKTVKQLIGNEAFHYIEPHHGKKLLRGLWEIGQAVQEQHIMEIEYERMKEPKRVKRRVLPVGIMFSEYYFYLAALWEDKSGFDDPNDLNPTVYRIDRISKFKVLDEHFRVPYRDRFEEGEFRKRIQFMYGGKLQHVRFRYTGPSIEAVLDRLPTARIIEEGKGSWTVEAEVFGDGIKMWINGQAPYVQIIT